MASVMVKVPSVNGPPTASSSRNDVREAVAFLESEDEGALSGFKFSWRRLFLHMGWAGFGLEISSLLV